MGLRIGVIGYGLRISMMVEELRKANPGCIVAAVTDPDLEQVRKRLARTGLPEPRFYELADEMLDRESLDGVLIGTRCSLHAEMAIKVLRRNIPLFLEKPVATTMEDWHRLKEASRPPDPVVVSFPLRFTPIVQLAKEIIDSGKIGTVEHVQAVNNVPYGGVYYHSWYRDESVTGGLFLQKATHDFDYINYLLGIPPVRLCALISKQIFKGSKPAGLRCSGCEEPDCAERVQSAGHDYCCFAVDTGNEDSGSALIQYDGGMHVSYSQNFFARREAQARGARLLGYKGTVEFDFYTQKLYVYHHHTSRVETHNLEVKEHHFGGDAGLASNFIEVMEGKRSRSTLEDGLLSTLISLKAREAALSGTYQNISENLRK